VRRVTKPKGNQKPKIILSLLPRLTKKGKISTEEEPSEDVQAEDEQLAEEDVDDNIEEEQVIEQPKATKRAAPPVIEQDEEEEEMQDIPTPAVEVKKPIEQKPTEQKPAEKKPKKQKKEKAKIEPKDQEVPKIEPPKKIADLGVSAGFEWDDSVGTKKTVDAMEVEEDENEEQVTDKKKTKLAKKKEKQQKQKEISQKEAELDQRPPETVSDFEKLLLSSPNSSFVWIRYMAYFISLTEVEKARAVAHRAT
jgi:rRNA biogenesis protein RRP5